MATFIFVLPSNAALQQEGVGGRESGLQQQYSVPANNQSSVLQHNDLVFLVNSVNNMLSPASLL